MALPPVVAAVIGWPDRAGFAWLAGFTTTQQAILALLRRALSEAP